MVVPVRFSQPVCISVMFHVRLACRMAVTLATGEYLHQIGAAAGIVDECCENRLEVEKEEKKKSEHMLAPVWNGVGKASQVCEIGTFCCTTALNTGNWWISTSDWGCTWNIR